MSDTSTLSVGVDVVDGGVPTTHRFISTFNDFVDAGCDEFVTQIVQADITTGVDLDFSAFASVTALIVKNRDAAHFVTMTYDDVVGGGATIALVIPAGGFVVVGDVDPAVAVNLTADTAACYCDVFIQGS